MTKNEALLLCLLLSCTASGAEEGIEIREGAWVGTLVPVSTGEKLMLKHQGNELIVGECADEERSQAISVDGIIASVFERNCGATTDFATHVELQRGEESATVAVFEGRIPVEVNWTEAGLSVSHSPVEPGRVYARFDSALGESVRYSAVGPPAPSSEYVAVSSFNYGATGRALGLPAELLQRVAGWSQEASGVYRSDWGTWTAEPPYGDDPAGGREIEASIRHYDRHFRPDEQ